MPGNLGRGYNFRDTDTPGDSMRARLQFLPGAATACLYSASIGIVTAAIGCMYARDLAFAARDFLAGFLLAAALFGYGLWRAHRPKRRAFLDRWYHAFD